jgi:hypothetical protein
LAGMSVTVCVPGSGDATVEGAVAERLDAFGPRVELEGTWMSLWDSWLIRGSHDEWGFWPLLGHEDDPRLIRTGFSGPGSRGIHWGRLRHVPAHCAGGPRSLLDLSERPACPRALAMQTWDVWQALSDRHPPPQTMSQIADRYRKSPRHGYDIEAVAAEFESQPLIQAFKRAHPVGGRDRLVYSNEFVFHPNVLIQDAAGGREAFADANVRAADGAGSLLTLDGWWVEPDGEAYHGACASSSCPHGPHPYAEAVLRFGAPEAKLRYLRELPGDVVIVQVHGHC